jgi:hypothetical protein
MVDPKPKADWKVMAGLRAMAGSKRTVIQRPMANQNAMADLQLKVESKLRAGLTAKAVLKLTAARTPKAG